MRSQQKITAPYHKKWGEKPKRETDVEGRTAHEALRGRGGG